MKKYFIFFVLICMICHVNAQPENVKVIIIRHAEKPEKGDNLTCQGLNRSMQLPGMLVSKFGVPDFVYVPSMALDSTTKHARMFETIIPLAAKYNLAINSKYAEHDATNMARDIRQKKGMVLVVWEHKAATNVVEALGVAGFNNVWGDKDYDSIWIVTIKNGQATIAYGKEDLLPKSDCP